MTSQYFDGKYLNLFTIICHDSSKANKCEGKSESYDVLPFHTLSFFTTDKKSTPFVLHLLPGQHVIKFT